ncbi:hypothetical protein GCM10027093_09020 [Paraburkholderia jirisanensis]
MTTADTQSVQRHTMESAKCVLRAGIWLIRNGCGRMMLLPYTSPSGAYWRCEFHAPGRRAESFYRYSTGSGTRFLANHGDGIVKADASPQDLAEVIIGIMPADAKAACAGDASAETLRWLVDLETAISVDLLPEAFHEYTDDYSVWRLVSLTRGNGDDMQPQPGYVPPR